MLVAQLLNESWMMYDYDCMSVDRMSRYSRRGVSAHLYKIWLPRGSLF